jgi:hypothetical protein
MRVPGGHAPLTIGFASARLICCQMGPLPSSVGAVALPEILLAGALFGAASLFAELRANVLS